MTDARSLPHSAARLADDATAALVLPAFAGGTRSPVARAAAETVVLVVRAGVSGNALAHEHGRARGGLEDVVDALDLERGAFLVRASADRLRDALSLFARDVLRGVWRA